ncbi:hypothetical protein VZO05_04095 [Aggregatilineales bacterium SYSU G02658]
MSSAGKTEADDAPIPRRIWFYLVGLLIVLIGGLFIGAQVLSVTLAALFPPLPPVPNGALEQRIDVDAQGDQVWTYEVGEDACAVTRFYEQIGQCERYHDCAQHIPSLTRVSVCRGTQPFSQFQMRWQAVAASHPTEPNVTVLTVSRRILWVSGP